MGDIKLHFAKKFGLAALMAFGAGSAGAATISETFATPMVVDGSSAFYSFNVGAGGTISDVNITLDFTKCDDPVTAGECVGAGYSFNNEIVFSLISPNLTTVVLVQAGTYSGQTPGDRVSVTFDDQASSDVGGPALLDGTFRPVGTLADFNGENSAGTWKIFFQDTVGADPLSLNGYSLAINTAAVPLPAVPLPAGMPLLLTGFAGLAGLRARKKRAMNA